MRYEQDFVWFGEYRTLLTGQSINSIFWRLLAASVCFWRFLAVAGGFLAVFSVVSGGFCRLLAVFWLFLSVSGGFYRFLSVSGGFLSVFSRFSLWFLWFFFGRVFLLVSFLWG